MPKTTNDGSFKFKMGDRAQIAGDYQNRALHEGHFYQRAWHRSRLHAVQTILNFELGDAVADFGCGSGILIDEICDRVSSVVGVDSNPEAVRFCLDRFSEKKNVTISHHFLHDTPIAPSSLHKVVCQEVLEHVYPDQARQALQHWLTLLRPGGRLYLTTPNDLSLWPLMETVMDYCKLAARMEEEQHVAGWSQKRFRKILAECGYTDIRTGTFNLFAPFAFALLGEACGKVSVQAESKLLQCGGPLLWATAQKPEGN